MAKNVTLGTLREDVRYRADFAATSQRLTDSQLDRLLALNLDRLMAVVSEAYGDDYFTFPVGFAVRRRADDKPPVRQIPFSAAFAADPNIDPGDYWLNAQGNPAPAFWKLRKLQYVEQGQIDDGGTLRPVADSDFGSKDVIAVTSWTGTRRPVRRMTMRQTDRRDSPSQPAYRLVGNDSLWLENERDPIASYVVWYTGLPLDLADENAETQLLPSWAEWLIQSTVAIVEQRDRRDPSVAVQLRDQAAEQIAEHARERDEWGPETVQPSRGRDGYSDQEFVDAATYYGDGF